MFQAGTNVFIGLFSIGTILALLTPLEAPASAYLASQGEYGQSDAVVNTQLASNESKTALESASLTLPSLASNAHIASFSEESAFLYSLKTAKIQPEDKSVLASAKLDVTEPTQVGLTGDVATSEAATVEIQPTVQPVAVSTEIEEAKDVSAYALNADKLFDMVNNYRTSIGLPAVQRDSRLMDMAVVRAPEVFDEIFVTANMHAGFFAREANLPYFSTEIIIYHNTEEGALNWWLNSPVHRGIIQNGTYTHAGIACDGKSCAMIYSGFQPKMLPLPTTVPSVAPTGTVPQS